MANADRVAFAFSSTFSSINAIIASNRESFNICNYHSFQRVEGGGTSRGTHRRVDFQPGTIRRVQHALQRLDELQGLFEIYDLHESTNKTDSIPPPLT